MAPRFRQEPLRCETSPEEGILHCGCGAPGKPDIWRWGRILFAAVLSVNSMAVALALNTATDDPADLRSPRLGLLGVTLLVALLVGAPLVRGAWEALRAKRIAIEFLFLLTLGGALGVSLQSMWRGTGPVYFEVLSILLTVYAFGVEVNRSVQSKSLQVLERYDADQRMARVRDRSGAENLVPASTVKDGDRVVVLPGELVPVDGIVVGAPVLLEESSLRGEFAPTAKEEGARIQAGAAVLDSQIEYEARPTLGSSLDALLCATRASISNPSRYQRAADRLAQWFLPVVASVSILTFVVWNALGDTGDALFHAMAVLLVACPCALGFGTPLALNTALNRLRHVGVGLPRVADVETLAAVDTVVFDKTGTLSSAQALVSSIVWTPTFEARKQEVMEMLAATEAGLPHPYARAIHHLCVQDGYAGGGWVRESLRILPGRGVTARLIREGKPSHDVAILRTTEHQGATTETGVEILVDGVVAGYAFFQEELHPAIADATKELAAMSIDVHLITGDTVDRASRTGIVKVRAGMDPVEKQHFIQTLRAMGKHVLFVGDGMNDAAAMGDAQISLAVDGGSSLARAVASGLWSCPDPLSIPEAVRIARQTIRRVRSNFRWALSYNIAGMTLAAIGLLHPVTAALLMVMSSAVVTWRALALLDSTDRRPDSSADSVIPDTMFVEDFHAHGAR